MSFRTRIALTVIAIVVATNVLSMVLLIRLSQDRLRRELGNKLRSVAVAAFDADSLVKSVHLIDVGTAKSIRPMEWNEAASTLGYAAFSPDGRVWCGTLTVHPKRTDRSSFRGVVRLWDPATGKVMASFEGEGPGSYFGMPVFSWP